MSTVSQLGLQSPWSGQQRRGEQAVTESSELCWKSRYSASWASGYGSRAAYCLQLPWARHPHGLFLGLGGCGGHLLSCPAPTSVGFYGRVGTSQAHRCLELLGPG